MTAIQEGISEREISGVFLQYQYHLRKAESVKKILELSAAFHLQLVDSVSAHRLEDKYSPMVQRCRAYIREHISEPITVASVASAIGYSRSYLSHVYRGETGDTVYCFIQQEKLDLAKQYLLSFSYSVTEIWKELGFCSQSHFTTFFKNLTGQTPTEFRQYSQTAETVNASEINTAEAMPPSYMWLAAENDVSEEHQKTLNDLNDYAENIGYKQESYFLYCVKKGRVRELEMELDDPQFVKTMSTLFENSRTLAYRTFIFMLPQIHSAAVDGGVSMKSASQLYTDFFERAHGADVPELLRLNREAFIEFATRVANEYIT